MTLFDDLEEPRPEKPATQPKRPPGTTERPAEPKAPTAAAPAGARPGPRILTVGELSDAISGRLRELGRVAVEGEISALKRAGSGHLYFGLKDGRAVVSCAIWQSRVSRAARFPLVDGMRVVCHGALDHYAPRGTYSLIVDRVEQRGLGELLAKLEELKRGLAAKGWFDRCRPLPPMPRVVGVVTSRDADAFQDILRTRSKRWPLYPLRLAHARVQGEGSALEVAAAIRRLDESGVDVIVVARGGGSIEDLWSFNELAVAEAIRASSVPVVTGVGHQTDVTLADHVADHRAHTPTDAAQMVIPDRRELDLRVERVAGYLAEAIDRHLSRREEGLLRLARARALRDPAKLLEDRVAAMARLRRRLRLAVSGRVDAAVAAVERRAARLARETPMRRVERIEARITEAGERLVAGAIAPIERRERALALAERSLGATSPFAVLERGYSITRRAADGSPLRAASGLVPGEEIETLFASGAVRSEVRETKEKHEGEA